MAKSLIAGESLIGLAIAFCALVVSVISILQSRQANRTAENAALARHLLTIDVSVDDRATSADARLEIKPTSTEFVLSDASLEFVRLPFDGQFPSEDRTFPIDDLKKSVQITIEDTVTPNSLGLSRVRFAIEYLLEKCSYPHKWRARGLTNYNEYDLAGYFPILVRVEYVHEGHTEHSNLLYEIFYSGWVKAGPNALQDGDALSTDEAAHAAADERDEPESSDSQTEISGLTLSKPRFVRRLEPTEEPRRLLRERFDQWLNEKFSQTQEVDSKLSY